MESTMPVWGAVALAVSIALITQLGALLVQIRQQQHDRAQKRAEEWHRNLRWSVEKITGRSEDSLTVGIYVLDSLDDVEDSSKEDKQLIQGVLMAVLERFGDIKGDNRSLAEYDEQDKRGEGDPA